MTERGDLLAARILLGERLTRKELDELLELIDHHEADINFEVLARLMAEKRKLTNGME